MKTKHRRRFSVEVPWAPDGLSNDALEIWPDLAKVPTAQALDEIRKRLKRNPDLRLELLSALTRFSESSAEPLTAAIAIYVSIAAFGTITFDAIPALAKTILVSVMVLVGFGLYMKYLDVVAAMDDRRKQSVVWLRALERYLE